MQAPAKVTGFSLPGGSASQGPQGAPITPSGPRGLHRAVSLEALAPSCRGGLKLSTSLYVSPGVG